MYRRLYFTGIAVYAVLFVLAVVFYKERIIFLDAAFTLFHLVKDGAFCIQIYRFGDAFTQIMPLLAYKAGASLDTIALSYSIGLASGYFILYIICGSVLKQYQYALVILLLNVLFTADTFYWPVSEVPEGMALLMLVLAMINGRQLSDIKPVRWLVLLVSLIILVFFHPLMAMLLIYCLVFFMLRYGHVAERKVLYGIAGVFFGILVVKMTFFRVAYEQHSLSGLKNFVRLFPDYFTMYSNKQFLRNCLTKYYWIPIISTSIIALYASRKEWLKLAFFIAAVFGYLLLVNVSYPTAVTPQFYIENLYLPISLFLALSFVFDVMPVLEQKKIALPVVAIIIITGCVRLYTTHACYTARLNWERQFLKEHDNKKLIVDAHEVHADILQMLWGTPYEFWLLSTSETGKTASIIIDNKPVEREWARDVKNKFVVNWDVFSYNQLTTKYFNFTDTTSGYIVGPR